MFLREILGVLHRVDQPGPATAPKRRDRLIDVLRDQPPTRSPLDRVATLPKLVSVRSATVLGALRRVDNARSQACGSHAGEATPVSLRAYLARIGAGGD